MGTTNDPAWDAKVALDIKYGEMRSKFNEWRTVYSREGVIEVVTYEIMASFLELPSAIRREYVEEAIAFIDTLGENFFHGPQ